ncbi:hypothetical protein GGX14DRAFT_400036 [Mycena pura]|uniref:Uncharacterized protein n=1 Tax=Mycena pura TaxID=153505 RepID=A0AAD6V424_9AGAR|nr:hypothetical protein GGX14DRAFT_400036 [Mycena pura]
MTIASCCGTTIATSIRTRRSPSYSPTSPATIRLSSRVRSTRMGGSGGIEQGYEAAARDGPHVDTSGLGVTMRRAHDTFEFRKQVLSVITKCFLDLTVSCLCPARGACKEKSVTEFEAAADPEGDDSFARAHKLAVVGHLANVYHRVVDAYLFVDRREAETSIGYFALQLLTVPSASVHPVRNHKLVSRILAIISAFFQIEDKHIVYLPHNRRAWSIACPSSRSNSCPSSVAHNREYMNQFAKTCQLFIPTNAWWRPLYMSSTRQTREAFSRATVALAQLTAAITRDRHVAVLATITPIRS